MTNEGKARPFHERFGINVGVDEAQRRFVNRAASKVFGVVWQDLSDCGLDPALVYSRVAYILGERQISHMEAYVDNDYFRCLRVLEALYKALEDTGLDALLSDDIDNMIGASEIDLGISWQPPMFVPTGAPMLDDKLVYEQLRWLSDPKYRTVYEPFKKGLSHFLETEKKPQLLGDVITDMYEALEALAKIVTGRPGKDLSANAEMFISKVKVSNHYKKLLKDYIAYANEFRHAEQEGKPRPSISRPEVESFVYLTGLFIRLAVQRS